MEPTQTIQTIQACPECGASWHEEETCQDHFHQMLTWEAERPGNYEVHHLMVLCYQLQHPSLYSPEALSGAVLLLADFLERGVTTQEVRRRHRATLDSGTRAWKIKGTPASHGVYATPVQWTITAANVTDGGVDNYCDNVRTWARSVYETLKTSGNFSPEELQKFLNLL